MYFYDYKVAIEIDENGHNNRNTDDEIKIQKATEQEFSCKFIRIDLDKKKLIFSKLSIKYFDILNNQPKKL